MRAKTPRHATVVAYLALFTSLAGTGYAVTKIDSSDVRNGSLRTQDLKDQKGVTGRDVRPDSLRGADIDEQTLDIPVTTDVVRGGGSGTCDPTGSAFSVCAQASFQSSRPERVLAVGGGGFYGEGGASESTCSAKVDGITIASATPGELTDDTSASASDGFTVVGVSDPVPAGEHTVALECNEAVGDARISGPVIAALGVGQ